MVGQRVDELVELQVLSRMHDSLREEQQATKTSGAVFLADAFAEFIATSSRLETSYRALQREVNRLDHELATRNALAEIATILAHEVRNPLASIELFVELLESSPESQGRWISNLRAGIRTLSATVNNVLTFHGSGPLRLRPVCLAALTAEAIQLMQPLAEQAEIGIDWTNNSQGLIVNANQSALQQVVINLITNAIRHTAAGGKICIALYGDGNQARLECSDSGRGLRSDQIEHLFEPGFSGSGDTCGLGLAVCARIMHQHQGQIAATNLTASGASFRIALPLLSTEAAQI